MTSVKGQFTLSSGVKLAVVVVVGRHGFQKGVFWTVLACFLCRPLDAVLCSLHRSASARTGLASSKCVLCWLNEGL